MYVKQELRKKIKGDFSCGKHQAVKATAGKRWTPGKDGVKSEYIIGQAMARKKRRLHTFATKIRCRASMMMKVRLCQWYKLEKRDVEN